MTCILVADDSTSDRLSVHIKDTLKRNVFLNYSYETRTFPLYFEDVKAAIRLSDEHTPVTVSVVLLFAPKNLRLFTAIPVTFRVIETFNNLKRICSFLLYE